MGKGEKWEMRYGTDVYGIGKQWKYGEGKELIEGTYHTLQLLYTDLTGDLCFFFSLNKKAFSEKNVS